jgi:tetratricopeptide (TPR) repeat protein
VATKCPKCHFDNPDTPRFCGECGTQLAALEDPYISKTLTLETKSDELTRGTVFAGRFELIEELGAGGMGQVYRAFDKEVGEEIALKVLHPEIALDKKTVERFRNEIKLARRITHKNVCRMHDLHQDGKQLFITMEYVSGQNLKVVIKQAGALSTGKAISIAKQVSEGLAEAHDLGVIHRDLKPQNIMVDKEGNAKIMDFGIARSLRTSGITAEGIIIGTPEYMAPEQVEGHDADQRTDIYALGAILFEMVTGWVPFKSDSTLSVAYKQKNEIPLSPRKLNSQIPEPFNQLILRCLEKEKEDRYQTADELLADLIRIEDGLPISERVILKARSSIRIAREKGTGLRRFLVPILVFLGLTITAAVIWRFVVRKTVIYPPPIENSIAVITFENQTGDPAYDFFRKSIPNLLITSLENSGLFRFVATRERMQDLLKQAGKRDVEFIDVESGFEACRREGIRAIALGSFVKAGDIFMTDVKILDVNTKQLLKSANSKGEGQESILRTQIDELTRKIAEGMGVAKPEIAASQKSIVEVTTDSMEAYKLYIKGLEEEDLHSYESAARYLERAVEMDPSFAMAYAALCDASTQLNNTKALRAALEKAKLYSARATEKERLYIDARYTYAILKDPANFLRQIEELVKKYPREKRFLHELAIFVKDNDPARAISLYERALLLDPSWTVPINSLALIYGNIGEFKKSLETLKKLASLTPEDPNVYESMGHTLFQMGKIDEAVESFKKALAITPDFAWSLSSGAYTYAFKEDYGQALGWMEEYISRTGQDGIRMIGRLGKAFYEFWLGRRTEALAELDRFDEIAAKLESGRSKLWGDWLRGWIHAEKGELEASARAFDKMFEFYKTKGYTQKIYQQGLENFVFGLLDVKKGSTEAAKVRLAGMAPLKAEYYQDQITYCEAILNAEISIAEGSPGKAIDLMKKAKPHIVNYINYPEHQVQFNLPAQKDVLARAYVAAGDLDKAIAEYERIATFDPLEKSSFLIYPLYNYRLARLYEEKGLKAKARDRYSRFLDLWKDADPDIPEVENARKRLAGLNQ